MITKYQIYVCKETRDGMSNLECRASLRTLEDGRNFFKNVVELEKENVKEGRWGNLQYGYIEIVLFEMSVIDREAYENGKAEYKLLEKERILKNGILESEVKE